MFQRGGIFYATRQKNGRQIRASLGTRDPEEAERAFVVWKRGRATPRKHPPRCHPIAGSLPWPEMVESGALSCSGWLHVMFLRTKHRADHKEIPFSLSMLDLMTMALRTEGRCALTGIQFSWARMNGAAFPPFAPSLDRIRPKSGYYAENCRLVCYAANVALSDWGEEVFKKLAVAYLELAR